MINAYNENQNTNNDNYEKLICIQSLTPVLATLMDNKILKYISISERKALLLKIFEEAKKDWPQFIRNQRTSYILGIIFSKLVRIPIGYLSKQTSHARLMTYKRKIAERYITEDFQNDYLLLGIFYETLEKVKENQKIYEKKRL